MPAHFQIRLSSRTASIEVLSILRNTLRQPLGMLKQKIVAGEPIIDEQPHHNAYDEFICSTTNLLQDLDAHGYGYIIAINGEPETVDYLRNIFARWHEIRRQIQT